MKRKGALLLSFIFILTLALPLQGFAANMDKALENAIKIAKAKFSVPESYKFSSNISTDGAKKIFYLDWRSTDGLESSNISARVDENGTIIGYSKYSPQDYIQTRKLPKFSRMEAKTKADGYIKWIEPGLLENLRYEESTQASIMDSSYYLSYYRVINGIPFYNDRVTVTVNRESGALQDYSRQWTDNLTFPAVKNTISLEKAEEAYSKNLGLKLIYKYSYVNDVMKAFPVYVPIYDNNYGIDAFTGARTRLFSNYYYGGYGDSAVNFSSAKSVRTTMAEEVKLNPDELNAVQNASKLMTVEEAEKIARNAKFLAISADSKLQSSNLNTNWPSKDEYIWSLQFEKPASGTSKFAEYSNVSVNAKDGVILSFYRGTPYIEGAAPKVDFAAAKTAVDAFLTENYPPFYKQTEYDKLNSERTLSDDTSKITSYNFVYSRLINGAAFPDNGFNIIYDAVNSQITSFNLNWYALAFPSIDKAIGVKAANEKLYKNVGLGLEYKFEYVNNPDAFYRGSPAVNAKVLLVYSPKPNKPLFIDAFSGNLLTYDGTAYKEAAKVSYTDIKGNAAEKQIMVLAENGVYLDGTTFKPNTTITQKDFLTLLSRTLSYYGPIITPLSTSKEVDDLYAYLQREGIVQAGEKAPANAVTREEAVKFLIRALKFNKVADIKGIYNCTYKDKDSINQNLIGYITIASGLGIIDGKSAYFKPKAKLTRGESAIMIYNYLQS